MLIKFLNHLRDLFFPMVCPFCDRLISEGDMLVCQECLHTIEFIQSPVCTCCGKPFHVKEMDDHYCGECLLKERYYSKVRAVLYYEKKVMEAIHRFKYSSAIYYAKPFSWLMYNRGKELLDFKLYDCVVPVPLYKKRLKQREYNQAQLLAEGISRFVNIPVGLFHLVRIRETPSQVGLKRDIRVRNVKGAFHVPFPERVKGKRVLLIDDVISTTATVNECARALKRAGAERIDVLALARGR